MRHSVPILGVPTHPARFAETVQTLLTWSQDSTRRYVSTATVHGVMSAADDATIASAFGGADWVAADGMPLVWLQRRAGHPTAERLYGPDLMLALCEAGLPLGLRHYFWGGAPSVAERLAANLQKRFDGLQVAGIYSPPIAPLEKLPDAITIARLNTSRADVVWVGLGSPKQDLWMQHYRPFLDAPLLIGVGAAFDFHAGHKRQAPRWMQRHGLEWLFRLRQEPRRLWRRYLIGNTRFVWQVWRQGGRG